jgi:hypothetical protein
MALTYQAISTAAIVASGDITLSAPAGAQAGDFYLACICYRDSAAFTLPGAWTTIAVENTGDTNLSTGATASGVVAYARRGASDPPLTFSRTAGDVAVGAILLIRPQNAGYGVAVRGSNSTTLTSASATVGYGGGIGTVSTDDLIFWVACIARQASSSGYSRGGLASISAVQERIEEQSATGADATLAVASGVCTAGGSTSSFESTASASAKHAGIAFALYEERLPMQAALFWAFP